MADHPFLTPIAPAIGPFAQVSFIEAAVSAGPIPAELLMRESHTGMVAFQRSSLGLTMAGDADLVDYRSPRGSGSHELIVAEVGSIAPGGRFEFDSLPEEARDVFCRALDEVGCAYRSEEHTTTAVLILPDSIDEYLAGLSKKERHEMRRKRRRYESTVGPQAFRRETAVGALFDQFIRFHRQSPGEKGDFMTPPMEAYFARLLELPGWGIDALVDGHGALVAAGFGYFDETGYYLYNSTYDPGHAEVSPGVVLLGSLIELNIDRQSPVFDFLKGDEHYKYRLGAEPRQLYRIEGSR